MALTDGQRLSYEANGYLVLRGALAGDQLETVKAAADRAEARWRGDSSLPGGRSNVLDIVQSPIEYDDVLLELLWNPGVFPLVRELLSDDVQMIDNDFFITPPHTPKTHAHWHHDVTVNGVFHPFSTVMVKVFYLLSDVNANSGGTAMIPGSHKFPMGFPLPKTDPRETDGAIVMTGKAGDAYLFNGRVYHAAVNNDSDIPRRVLIYNYGHNWMRMWPGYEPSDAVKAKASNELQKQLLGMSDAYVSSLSAAG